MKTIPWNWDIAKSKFWEIPADELYAVAARWKEAGKKTVLDIGCGLGRNAIFHCDYIQLQGMIKKVKNFLKPDGRFFITFNSKNNATYTKKNDIVVDNFTRIRTDGLEKGIAHTFLNYTELLELLEDFEILKVQHIQDFYEAKKSWHYFVEGKAM